MACVLIDEAQFLTPEQVDQALAIAVLDEIPVVAFGIRTDFRTKAFPGSQRLMEVAHSLQEMKTICRCGKKAIFNARLGEQGIIREGEQVMIDGESARYEALCARCYLEFERAYRHRRHIAGLGAVAAETPCGGSPACGAGGAAAAGGLPCAPLGSCPGYGQQLVCAVRMP